MLPVYAIIYSLIGYSALRYIDVWSTKMCLARLDPQIHEVNPLMTQLLKKMDFNKTMLLTWIVFAVPISVLDTIVVNHVLGLPLLWLLFGIFHVMAAANNLQIHFKMDVFGADVVEENTKRLIIMLKNLSFWGKLVFLAKTNFLNVFFALYSVITLSFFLYLLSSIDVAFKYPIPVLFAATPFILIFDLMMFFPTIVLGSLMISIRRLQNPELDMPPEGDQEGLTVSVELLEKALEEARENDARSIKFLIPNDALLISRTGIQKPKGGEETGS
jgi:hypothetical protein